MGIEVRHSYYDWVFVNEEFALRVHRKRVTSKETTVPVETKKPGPKRPSPVQVEDRVKNIINNIDTSEKKYIVRDDPVEYEPEYIEKPSPIKPKYVEKPSPAKPKYVEKPSPAKPKYVEKPSPPPKSPSTKVVETRK